jgi:hypothetical protein
VTFQLSAELGRTLCVEGVERCPCLVDDPVFTGWITVVQDAAEPYLRIRFKR